MCEQCIYFAQFPGVTPSTVITGLNSWNTAAPPPYTVGHLISDNPQFWLQPGIAGQQTLTTVVTHGIDLILNTAGGFITASIQAHPVHGPRR